MGNIVDKFTMNQVHLREIEAMIFERRENSRIIHIHSSEVHDEKHLEKVVKRYKLHMREVHYTDTSGFFYEIW